MYPQRGQMYALQIEYVGVNYYTGLGVFNVLGTGERIEIRLSE